MFQTSVINKMQHFSAIRHLTRMVLQYVCLFSLLTCSLFSAVQAQEANEDQLSLNMRDADLRSFIQWVATHTGKNIAIHPSVRGAITVIANESVNPEEAYQIFLTILQMNNFSVVETDDLLTIIPAANAKFNALPFQSDQTVAGENIALAIIHLKHASANEISTLIRPLMPSASHLAVYQPSNALILTDSVNNLEKLQRIVAAFDTKKTAVDIEVIELTHASADEIASILKNLTKSLTSGEAAANQSELSIATDSRTNSIILIGNANVRTQARNIIKRLDQAIVGSGNSQVVYLNYIDAAEIVPILTSVGNSYLKDNKTENKDFSIESSETTNALVISAPTALMNNFQSIIEKLDIRRAQVLVEAIIVQVNSGDALDLEVIWGSSNLYDETSDGSVGVVNAASGTTLGNLIGTSSTTVTNEDGTTTPAPGDLTNLLRNSGFTYGFLKDGDLRAVFRALGTKSQSNIIATPAIVALDNEEATLLSGQNVPFISGSTSTNRNDGNPFTTIQRQDIGTTLKITPRINQGDSITLQFEQTTESVDETTTGLASDLVTNKTEISTNVLVQDGQVLVVGGLISNTSNRTRSQVPILGRIPFLGQLFRQDGKNQDKRNLMVFIRPAILKDQLLVNKLTSQRYAFMREQQLQLAAKAYLNDKEPVALKDFEVFSADGSVSSKANGDD